MILAALALMLLPAQQSADLDAVPGTTGALMQLAAGTVPSSLGEIEARLLDDQGADWRLRSGRGSALLALTQLGYSLRGTGPALFATSRDSLTLLLVNQAARDTAEVRLLIAAADAASRQVTLRNQAPPLALAEAELWLGDTAAAVARLRRFEQSWTSMDPSVMRGMVPNGWTIDRTRRLLADLEASRGDTASVPACEGVVLRAAGRGETRFRYDATAWVRMPFQRADDRPMQVARITLVARERVVGDSAGLLAWRQQFDSAALDLPVVNGLGYNGAAMLRRAQLGMRGLTSLTVTDSAGRWIGRQISSGAEVPAELERVMATRGGFGPLGAAITFPRYAVTAGDSWTDSITLYAPGGVLAEDTRAAVRYTLLRVERIEGRRVAFIAIAAETGELDAEDGRSSASLSGELLWDVDDGVAIRLAASLRAVMVDRLGTVTPARVLMTALRLPPQRPVESLAMRAEMRPGEAP
jgi:hypothetical protein